MPHFVGTCVDIAVMRDSCKWLSKFRTPANTVPLTVKKKLSNKKVNVHSDDILGQSTTRILPVVSFKLQSFWLWKISSGCPLRRRLSGTRRLSEVTM
jgi:hypothetical protein